MNNICTSLPGIVAIGYLDCDKLTPNIAYRCGSQLPVGIFTAVTPICFVGNPTCVASSQYKNNGRSFETTLKFSSNDNLPLNQHIGFVVKDASGKSYLIGTRERQFPTIKSSKSSGTPSGDPAVVEYEVKWTSAICSLIPCSV